MDSVGIFSQSNPNYDRNVSLGMTGVAAAFAFIAVSMAARFGLHHTLQASLLAGGIAVLPITVSGVIAATLLEAKEEGKGEKILIVIEGEPSPSGFISIDDLPSMDLETLYSRFFDQSLHFEKSNIKEVLSIADDESDPARKVAILAGYLAGFTASDRTGYVSNTLQVIAQTPDQEERAQMLIGALHVLKG